MTNKIFKPLLFDVNVFLQIKLYKIEAIALYFSQAIIKTVQSLFG
jgi:hypothetical protein